MKIMDIHSHTYYSGCGRDDPHLIIDAAIEGGIEIFGISDHNYGIGERKAQYLEEISALKEEYKGKIKLLCGIEISTLPHLFDVKEGEIRDFDYCLIEHLDNPDSIAKGDIISFAKQFEIPSGIAHTDLFSYCEKNALAPLEFFTALKESGIFWELNVNFDSIHNFREHAYVSNLFEDETKLEILKKSGIFLSVGFDGHRVEDYLPERVKEVCEKIEKHCLPMVNL